MYQSHGIRPEIKEELRTAILERCKANPARTAYVVPQSEIVVEPARFRECPNEKFLVIALPDKFAGEINYVSQQIGVEVRTRSDGIDTECVLLAGGDVAISGQAIQATAGADLSGQLVIAWMFADSLEFVGCTLSATHMEDLQAAQQIAQSNACSTLREGTVLKGSSEQAIEVFEHIVVAVQPLL